MTKQILLQTITILWLFLLLLAGLLTLTLVLELTTVVGWLVRKVRQSLGNRTTP